MKTLKKLFFFSATLLLSGCQLDILNPKGIIAIQERNLLIEATLLMLIVVIPVIIMNFIFVWRYRAGKGKGKYTPKWAHNNSLEAVVWAIPCIIIGVLATMTWYSTHQLDPYKPLNVKQKPLVIQAVALNWRWMFIYPNQNIATINYVQIPVHTPVRFLVTSDAPMNSLEIPQLAGQIYAMTGMRTKLNLMANEVGTYRGLSTNFSGEGFSGMHFIVRVDSKNAFENWVAKTKQSKNPLTLNKYKSLAKDSQDESMHFFSSPAKNLFNSIIMKYMKPGMVLDNDDVNQSAKR